MSKLKNLLDRAQKLTDKQKIVLSIAMSVLVIIFVVLALSLINSLLKIS